MTRPSPGFCSFDEIIVEPAPASLHEVAAAQEVEGEAFLALSHAMTDAPGSALQRFVDLAMEGTDAESAGISLEEQDGPHRFFRWIATAGAFARFVNGTMPREFSPCGAAVDGGRSLVMRDPVRYYAYFSQVDIPVHSLLLVPFRRGGNAVGTVWVLSHTQDKVFTVADLRFVENLAGFATDVLDAIGH
jgi:GAF domain-containing protein